MSVPPVSQLVEVSSLTEEELNTPKPMVGCNSRRSLGSGKNYMARISTFFVSLVRIVLVPPPELVVAKFRAHPHQIWSSLVLLPPVSSIIASYLPKYPFSLCSKTSQKKKCSKRLPVQSFYLLVSFMLQGL